MSMPCEYELSVCNTFLSVNVRQKYTRSKTWACQSDTCGSLSSAILDPVTTASSLDSFSDQSGRLQSVQRVPVPVQAEFKAEQMQMLNLYQSQWYQYLRYQSEWPQYQWPQYQWPQYLWPQSRCSQDPCSQDLRSQDPRSQDPRSQDPRSQDPRFQDPRSQDPRSQDPCSQDPRSPDSCSENKKPQHQALQADPASSEVTLKITSLPTYYTVQHIASVLQKWRHLKDVRLITHVNEMALVTFKSLHAAKEVGAMASNRGWHTQLDEGMTFEDNLALLQPGDFSKPLKQKPQGYTTSGKHISVSRLKYAAKKLRDLKSSMISL